MPNAPCAARQAKNVKGLSKIWLHFKGKQLRCTYTPSVRNTLHNGRYFKIKQVDWERGDFNKGWVHVLYGLCTVTRTTHENQVHIRIGLFVSQRDSMMSRIHNQLYTNSTREIWLLLKVKSHRTSFRLIAISPVNHMLHLNLCLRLLILLFRLQGALTTYSIL